MRSTRGVIRVVNAAALRLFDYRQPADLVGQPVLRYIAPEHREALEARVATRLRSEPTPATVEIEGPRSVTKVPNAVAHEINIPLAVVGRHLELLAAKVGDRPELRRHFEPRERAVQRIAR